MVDNRSAGLLGIGGNINFKSGDISGTAAKTSDDRASQGTEYFAMQQEEQQNQNEQYVDRSMQLRASLNSLALINVASVLNNKMRPKTVLEQLSKEESISSEKKVQAVNSEKQDNNPKNKDQKNEKEK